ncbi:MAG TPA: ATP-binding protein, partial [Polyangiaceae bacterium]|nr:ATP-binding protein [Polyangiaceae bacterium]
DRLFGWLMLAQWAFAIVLSLTVSPRAWAGGTSSVHLHVYTAVGLGGLISFLPWVMMKMRHGRLETRIVIACAQMLWSALLVHLTGGRIETHFHVFGSLAILAFYRDIRVVILATVVVASEHFFRGMYWPESIYGIASPEWWRFLEHAGWVVFIDVFLVIQCVQGIGDMRAVARRQAEVELLSESEREKSEALDKALIVLKESQEASIRNERLAAVGQLAASVGHELRNPLTAVRNACTYIGKKIDSAGGNGHGLASDERVKRFRVIIDRELDASAKIISDLLDFARARQPERQPCPLRALVAEAMEVVPKHAHVQLVNEVPEHLPFPSLDKDQFRQVFLNLIQNASEAIDKDRGGRVLVQADADAGAFRIRVVDDGPGMEKEVVEKIFQPLFSTKTKGTGLGLAIVQGTIARHGGRVEVTTAPGEGSVFTIELPRRPSLAPTHDGGPTLARLAG